MKRSTFLGAGILAVAALGPAHAQNAADTVRLDAVVVTATKVPLPLRATTAATTLLDVDRLIQQGMRTVADALRTTPGAMVVQTGSNGAITSLFLRGGESDYVQVLIDGVRVNNPGGVFDFGNLTLDQVERIEIVRGPVSVLYGSDAVSGVVQIFTRRPSQRTAHLRVSTSSGERVGPDSLALDRYATTSLSGDAGGTAGRMKYYGGLAHTSSGGLYAFNNAYRNTTGSARAAIGFGNHLDLSWTARLADSRFRYPTNGSGVLTDHNQYRDTESFTTSAELAGRWSAFTASLRGGLHNQYERYVDLPDSQSDTLGTFTSRSRGRVRRSFIETSGHYRLGVGAIVTGGVEVERQDDRNSYASDGQFGPFDSRFGRSRTNRAVYGQLVHAAGALAVNAGVRRDANDRFGDFTTWRAGAAVQPFASTRVRIAAGTAFKEPTFFENYAEGFTRGNPALEPEHTRTWEVGVEQQLPRSLGAIEVTRFVQRFRDLIQYVERPFGSTEPNYLNITAANADGTEVTLNGRAGARVNLGGSFTWLRTRVTGEDPADPAFEPGQPLVRRPSRQGSIFASYTHNGRRADARVNHIGKRDDLDFSSFPATRVNLEAYTTLDLGVGSEHRVAGKPVSLSLRLHNALNERYEEVLNFPAARRTLLIGAETTLGW